MVDGVTINGSDVRNIIAKFLGIPVEAIIPMKYSYVIKGMTADEIKEKLEE